jgi:hypothetical protein
MKRKCQWLWFFIFFVVWVAPLPYSGLGRYVFANVEKPEVQQLVEDLAPPIAPRRDDGLDELPEDVFVAVDPKDDPSHPINWGKANRELHQSKNPKTAVGSKKVVKGSSESPKAKLTKAQVPKKRRVTQGKEAEQQKRQLASKTAKKNSNSSSKKKNLKSRRK